MAANTSAIFVLTPIALVADFTAKTACTTRAPTVTASLAAANIFALGGVAPTAGRRIDYFKIKGASSSVTAPTAAQIVTIWLHDGTTAYPLTEINVSLVTPSTTNGSFEITVPFIGGSIPSGYTLYASTTITTTASTTAFVVRAEGGDYQ